jgi:hypothetical protein
VTTPKRPAATQKRGGKSKALPRKNGRPALYHAPHHDDAAEKLTAQFGFVAEMLATAFGVSTSAIEKWQQEHDSFLRAIKRGKDRFDSGLVENATLRSATGFYQPVKKIVMVEGKPTTVETEEYYPPMPAAQRLWLFNRSPERWRDKQEVSHGVTDELGALLKNLDGQTRGLGASAGRREGADDGEED